jgi:tRNA threonylcarbamoyladenosine biosynthesis protein TsaE
MIEKSLVLESAEATRRFGTAIAKNIDGTAIVTVSGPLGAGKTTLAQGVARGLGIEEAVTSPTFTMMNEYDSGRLPLFHLDLYRLQETPGAPDFQLDFQMLAAELDEIMLAPSVVLVEWPEFFAEYFDLLDRVEITLQYSDDGDREILDDGAKSARRAIVRGCGKNAAHIVDRLAPITN